MQRRHLLALGGTAGLAAAVPGARAAMSTPAAAEAGHAGHHGPTVLRGAPATVAPFSVRMPIPPVAAPSGRLPDADLYQVDIRPADVEILPGVLTPALTYGGRFVGPTIRACAGRRAVVTFTNRHDAAANVHLHGGHTPASSDGHPMDLIDPGASRGYLYPNRQRGTTLWYHDHTHHMEAEHVYRGLHGFYLVDDPAELSLGLPDGSYDIPIMLRDALFDADGSLVFGNPAERPTLLANGRPQPYFPVAARKYRFRLLNAATERVFRLDLGGAEMIQIGTDGGLLPAPLRITELVMGSGERADVVIDFSAHPVGTQLVLADATGPVLRFDVVRRAADPSRVPARLRPLPALPPATVTRDISLNFALVDGVPTGQVNGVTFDPDRVDFQVRRGATEIWRVTNLDVNTPYGNVNHNFHLHLVQFRLLDRDGVPASGAEAGLKDTVTVPAGSTIRVQATFDGYPGRYVYHCHMLEHSSAGMMAQLEVVD